MTQRRGRPTMVDVARRAGTSTAVVSYVVNGGPRPVAAGTRALVERAIDELGYRRDPLAGALSAGRTNLVGLLVPDSSNAFFSEMAQHVEQQARRRGLLMLLGNTSYHPAVEQDYEAAFADLRAVGTLVTSIAAEARPYDNCPRVYIHSKPAGTAGPSVVFDDLNGAIEAVDHLCRHGHRDIHCVTGPDDFGPTGRREPSDQPGRSLDSRFLAAARGSTRTSPSCPRADRIAAKVAGMTMKSGLAPSAACSPPRSATDSPAH